MPGEEPPAELWQRDAQGKHSELLLRTHNAQDIKNVVAGFENLKFSTDGKLVYFTTPAFATCGAVHAAGI